jgi:hypothetical protein
MSCVRFVIGCVAALGATCALAGCASDAHKVSTRSGDTGNAGDAVEQAPYGA